MPGLEHIEAMASTPAPAATSMPTETDDPHPHQAARELTQTDHLNRRLLKSLLDTMQMQMQSTDDAIRGNEDGSNDESSNEFDE
ncbi:uncharacterized protein LOC108160893 [Drosophila miranda]|uniref:uncharacterized protein LOC108160893 n=1 Tax=Drosophila miranda TaxID=7229 RepID=UPI0007E7DC82|nr:uncharacterized protein LOC108160893 [Drosophila miranda]